MIYNPPYARPIDDEFAWCASKMLHPMAEATTLHSSGFVLQRGQKRIAVLIGPTETPVHAHRCPIYVFSPLAIIQQPYACLHYIAKKHRWLFSPDKLPTLEVLSNRAPDEFYCDRREVVNTEGELVTEYVWS